MGRADLRCSGVIPVTLGAVVGEVVGALDGADVVGAVAGAVVEDAPTACSATGTWDIRMVSHSASVGWRSVVGMSIANDTRAPRFAASTSWSASASVKLNFTWNF